MNQVRAAGIEAGDNQMEADELDLWLAAKQVSLTLTLILLAYAHTSPFPPHVPAPCTVSARSLDALNINTPPVFCFWKS